MNKDEAFALWASKHNMDDGHLPWETDSKVLLAVFTAGWDAHAESLKQATMPWEGASDGITAEDIYSAYPRKESRGDSIKAIQRTLKTVPGDKLLAIVKQYAEAVMTWPHTARFAADGRSLVPMCATWMNKERWRDDPAVWQRGGHIANPSQFSKTYQ